MKGSKPCRVAVLTVMTSNKRRKSCLTSPDLLYSWLLQLQEFPGF